MRNLLRNRELVSLPRLADRGRESRHDLQGIADDPIVGDLENGRLLVTVNGHDGLCRPHARQVLDGPGDTNSNIERGTDRTASLADLVALGPPAVVSHGARAPDSRVAEGVGQFL